MPAMIVQLESCHVTASVLCTYVQRPLDGSSAPLLFFPLACVARHAVRNLINYCQFVFSCLKGIILSVRNT